MPRLGQPSPTGFFRVDVARWPASHRRTHLDRGGAGDHRAGASVANSRPPRRTRCKGRRGADGPLGCKIRCRSRELASISRDLQAERRSPASAWWALATRRAVVSAAPAAVFSAVARVERGPAEFAADGPRNVLRWAFESLSQIAAGLDAGYRLLDTAAHYESESSVGAAVEDAVRRGTVRRDEITICTKLWMDDLGYDSALRAARCSLERLRSERLDVFLVHFPGTIDAVQDPKRNRQLRADTWRALETLQADGVAKRIGVSNWTRRHLKETLASCQIKPELLQIEFHPRLQQSALLADAADAGIKVMAAVPLATGADALLADKVLARVATHGARPRRSRCGGSAACCRSRRRRPRGCARTSARRVLARRRGDGSHRRPRPTTATRSTRGSSQPVKRSCAFRILRSRLEVGDLRRSDESAIQDLGRHPESWSESAAAAVRPRRWRRRWAPRRSSPARRRRRRPHRPRAGVDSRGALRARAEAPSARRRRPAPPPRSGEHQAAEEGERRDAAGSRARRARHGRWRAVGRCGSHSDGAVGRELLEASRRVKLEGRSVPRSGERRTTRPASRAADAAAGRAEVEYRSSVTITAAGSRCANFSSTRTCDTSTPSAAASLPSMNDAVGSAVPFARCAVIRSRMPPAAAPCLVLPPAVGSAGSRVVASGSLGAETSATPSTPCARSRKLHPSGHARPTASKLCRQCGSRPPTTRRRPPPHACVDGADAVLAAAAALELELPAEIGAGGRRCRASRGGRRRTRGRERPAAAAAASSRPP